jgi:hypothetical protein
MLPGFLLAGVAGNAMNPPWIENVLGAARIDISRRYDSCMRDVTM